MIKTKHSLLFANILLVFFLILLNNLKVIPLRAGDFIFFSILAFMFALYRPGWAFLFFIGTIALENINLAPVDLGIVARPYQMIGALIVLAIFVRFIFSKLYFKLVKFEWHDYALLAVTVAGFIGIINALDKIASLKLAIIFATFFVLYYLTRNYIQNAEDLQKVIPFFLSSGIVVILYGIWQNWGYMHSLPNFETMPGRPNGTFAEADWLGIFLVMTVSAIYSLIYLISKKNSNDQIQISNKIQNPNFQITNYQLLVTNYFPIVALCLLLTTLYIILILTVSRSAWLGALAATIAFLLIIFTNLRLKNWQWKETIKIKLGIIASLIIAIVIVYVFNLTNFQLFNRVQSAGTGLQKITISCDSREGYILSLPREINDNSELEKYGCRHINLENIEREKAQGKFVTEIFRKDPNVNTRKIIYQKSWEQIKKHPILGIGWGSISEILGRDGRGTPLNSSNLFLEIWLGSGIIGLAAFLAVWCYVIFKSVKNYCLNSDNLQKTINLFIITSWIGLTVANFFNAGIFLGFLWVWIAVAQVKS